MQSVPEVGLLTMRFNVLVVDDNAVMRTVITRTLKMSGIPLGEVHHAADGVEALDVLGRAWVDLALVDINMPVMNGEELIDRVRDDPELRDLAIIVVSTEGSETRIEKVRRQGARFVHKPFTPEQIRNTILEVTGVQHVNDSDDPRRSAQGSGDFHF
jgi:two-component system chemotaxis response regulator CheY